MRAPFSASPPSWRTPTSMPPEQSCGRPRAARASSRAPSEIGLPSRPSRRRCRRIRTRRRPSSRTHSASALNATSKPPAPPSTIPPRVPAAAVAIDIPLSIISGSGLEQHPAGAVAGHAPDRDSFPRLVAEPPVEACHGRHRPTRVRSVVAAAHEGVNNWTRPAPLRYSSVLVVPIPIIVAGGVGVAMGLIAKWVLEQLGHPKEREPSTSRPEPNPDSPTRRSSKPQCVKLGLMVWLRLSMQVRAIVKLVWHRASMQEARELIRALNMLPETPRRAMRRSLRDDDDPDDRLFPRRSAPASPPPWPDSSGCSSDVGGPRSLASGGVDLSSGRWSAVKAAVKQRRGWRQSPQFGPDDDEWFGPCPRTGRGGDSLRDSCSVRPGTRKPGTTVIWCTPCQEAAGVDKLGDIPGEPDAHFRAL